MKTANCKVRYNGWNCVKEINVTSPSGKMIYLKVVNVHGNHTKEVAELLTKWFHKYQQEGKSVLEFTEEITYSAMKELLRISKQR